MGKYNLSNIMKRAHGIKSENTMNVWSECLKMSWEEAKTPIFDVEEIMIKRWFLDKNFTQNERLVIESSEMGGEMEVINETEKAVQIKADSDYGVLKFWCPRSCIYTADELRKEMQKRACKVNSGLKYNELLLKLAKENAIKGVRKGMKTLTLVKKLSAAGVEVPER